jgi:aminomethyltransferase
MKRTPLFAIHQSLGGKLIEFGGWEMPVQYTSIVDEHQAVRSAAGLFDISHMGEVIVTGTDAASFLNRSLTNDISKLSPGLGQYTIMCNERGGAIDDLYVYQFDSQTFLLIINASRIEADVPWLQQQLSRASSPSVQLRDVSGEMGAVAVQGPRVAGFIDACFPGATTGGAAVQRVSDLKKNQIGRLKFQGADIWISRTGYTGEDGFEVVAPARSIEAVWNALMTTGKPFGLKPAGLGARDTLRTEVCYPLYGHELDENTTPIEAGLGFFVGLDKGPFTGREVLARQKADGVTRKLVAFKMGGKSAPPRPGYPILKPGDSTNLGTVASGTQSPSLGAGIGMGYVPVEFAKPQTPIEIEIRGRRSEAQVVPKPFYRKPTQSS